MMKNYILNNLTLISYTVFYFLFGTLAYNLIFDKNILYMILIVVSYPLTVKIFKELKVF